ncbi:uncharacterized protein LOC127749560 [Frankliniella occidentalis]|uniref:Uncharacterized protein LOC127749560 n=1 Tax=Frankliniella occidentalis TaxID=133901 RepID=A0A9C6X045_FRAOC|nr:uncharacterized protein LOC127749560 [Frankliniella occidentalis]
MWRERGQLWKATDIVENVVTPQHLLDSEQLHGKKNVPPTNDFVNIYITANFSRQERTICYEQQHHAATTNYVYTFLRDVTPMACRRRHRNLLSHRRFTCHLQRRMR